MQFTQMVKRLTIDTFFFLAAIMSLIFIYFQMVPFIRSAIVLKALNAQLTMYILYSFLLVLLPCILLFHGMRRSKKEMLRKLFYGFAAVIIAGSVADIIKYNFFTGYSFTEGDAIFVNIMWNMPNMAGVLLSAIIASMYICLGRVIKTSRRKSFVVFFLIFSLSAVVPFAYTYMSTGYLPRQTFVEKQAMIIPEYALMMVALTICVTSRRLWVRHIWDY